MFSVFFTSGRVVNFTDVANSNTARFNKFFHAMLDSGVYLAPSAFEAGFLSVAHTEDVLDTTIQAADQAFATL